MSLALVKPRADFSAENWLRTMHILNYKVFIVEPFNLNIVGWRNRFGEVDEYCDYLAVYYMERGTWKVKTWEASTRPGKSYLLSPINKKGTAILKPGQYLNSYALGQYKGSLALRQILPVKVFRDDNKDVLWDTNAATTDFGKFGIHIHRSSRFAKIVGRNSAGCQVFKNTGDYLEFIDLCQRAAAVWGNKFTYTLLEF